MMEYLRFGELYAIPSSNGLSRPSAVRGAGYKMVNMGELFSNGIINDIPMERVQMSDKELSKFLLEKGDLLFARQSLVAEGAGKCSYVNDLTEETTFESHLIRVRLNPKRAISKYFYYLFQLPNNPIKTIVNQCAQAGIRGSELVRVKVPCPSIKVQKKIASILSAYDSQIENNQKRIKLLEKMAENLYKEWFVRFRFPGYETAEFEGEVPKGWLLEKLNDFGIILETGSRPKGGIDASVENGIPSLGAEAINGLAEFDYNNFKLVSLDYYNSMKRGKSKGNHILVYKDGAYIGKVTLFRNAFPFNTYSINEHVFFLNTKDVNYQNYLYFTLHQPVFFTMMQNLNRNAAQPGLSQQDMFGIKVFKPAINVVTAFNSFVEPILDEVFNLAKENRLLTTQRDLLLPRLMSGKLSI